MKKTARQRVFEALYRADDRGCTTAELCQPDVGGVRFSARILELREEGMEIAATYERPGSHRYVLDRTSLPAPESGPSTTHPPALTQPPAAAPLPPEPVDGPESGVLFLMPALDFDRDICPIRGDAA